MLFLILFQFGRLLSWLVAGDWTISQFNLVVAKYYLVGNSDLKRSMILVPLSASFVYLGFFYREGRKTLTFTDNESMRRFFGWLYFLTIPFVIYKGISYLTYTMANGGYVATYLDGGEHLDQVGIVIRALALLNTMFFLPYLIVETRMRFVRIAIVSFLLVMVLELLTGFRGKFFINLMLMWLVYNIKRKSSFNPISGLLGALALLSAAVGAEIFRESKSGLDVNLVEYFLYTQGVSFFVTVSAVSYYDIFHAHAWNYLIQQFLLPYQHLSLFPEGALFTLDLTSFLNPNIVSYALGTGEAYLAHLYLIGGWIAVCLGSLLLGRFTLWISQAQTVFWRTIALSIMMWIPYMPRSGYLEPLAMLSKYFIMALVGFGAFTVFEWLNKNLKPREERHA